MIPSNNTNCWQMPPNWLKYSYVQINVRNDVQTRSAYIFLAAKHLTGYAITNTVIEGINIPAMFRAWSKLPYRIATLWPRSFGTKFGLMNVGKGPILKWEVCVQ